MIIGLVVVLLLVLLLPILSRKVEQNLEAFLLIMGLSASIISGVLSMELIAEIFQNKFMYMITVAVFAGGMIFKTFNEKFSKAVQVLIDHTSLKLVVFLVIVVLGLISSIITAIIASLLLVQIVSAMPIKRKDKINITIAACFSIGLGAALTPIGEPLSTVVVSKLDVGFWFLFQQLGALIIPGIFALGIIGAFFANKDLAEKNAETTNESETYRTILVRTLKIFIFVIALELLGRGFKVFIDLYVIKLDSHILYWVNIISAVLDNATLASAEISAKMSLIQIKSVLMGLLISGGMMIPGNIPNIISADKLKIRSSEWVKLGIPLGLVILVIYYIILFI